MSRLVAVLALVAALAGGPARASGADGRLARIVIDGTINPAVAEYIDQSIARAAADGSPALLIQLDTPGGLLQSTRAIVKRILGAPLPVIVYVAPSGGGAGSAGVFITLAAHVAAMAPGTSIGAAHPVGGQGEELKGPLGEKIENFTASFGEAIARQRGRNVKWAVKAVRKSESITAEEAAKILVVDFVAKDVQGVLQQASGRKVDVAGTERTLDFSGVIEPSGTPRVETYEMRFAQRLLNVLADPNIAYLLMMAGVLGLYVEFTHPGLWFPGITGGICLLLALAALQVLPVTYSALGLMALGLLLLIAEAFLPTFGLVGLGGAVAFVLGSLFLFDRGETGIAVSRSLVFGAGGAFALVILVIGALVMRSERRPPVTGAEAMLGAVGVVREPLAPRGTILVRGEYWTAESDAEVGVGERVEVTAVDGLTLRVRPAGVRGA
jgi:membrane-bound serine protease (ClpP class)